jgi:hypothetical protein
MREPRLPTARMSQLSTLLDAIGEDGTASTAQGRCQGEWVM